MAARNDTRVAVDLEASARIVAEAERHVAGTGRAVGIDGRDIDADRAGEQLVHGIGRRIIIGWKRR